MNVVAIRPAGKPLLSVRDLTVAFPSARGMRTIVDGLSFDVAAGETVCIMGESGSGKSLTAQAIMGLVETPPASIGGRIIFDGTDLLQLDARRRRDMNGPQLGLVFQDSLAALNPAYSVGWQIAEAFRRHRGMYRRAAFAEAETLLRRVGIPDPRRRVRQYPHQFSGGMRQRAAIAMAIALRPRLLIADEPTTALDVTTQAQVLELLRDLQRETGMAVIFITHDLGVVSDIADRVVVMYGGRAAESGPAGDVLDRPRHPYTGALLASWPAIVPEGVRPRGIPGAPPDFARLPPGCAFAPRCGRAIAVCGEQRPAIGATSVQSAACFNPLGRGA
jgi:oligopeptide transport system ATP-binding protein